MSGLGIVKNLTIQFQFYGSQFCIGLSALMSVPDHVLNNYLCTFSPICTATVK